MRTTVTLDPDVAAKLEALARENLAGALEDGEIVRRLEWRPTV